MTEYKSTYDQSYALIVGINSYNDSRFRTLMNAESDAQALAELLSSSLYGFDIQMLLGSQATKLAIQRGLSRLRGTQPDDRVLVYFACHGYTIENLRKRETGYLASADTDPDEDYTGLPLADVTDLRNHALAKHILFIFDACYSGRVLGLGRASEPLAVERFRTRTAYQALAAGNKSVADYPSMTAYMLDLLRNNQAIDPHTNLCTLASMGSHLTHIIANAKGEDQVPITGHLEGSDAGQFIFYQHENASIVQQSLTQSSLPEKDILTLEKLSTLLNFTNDDLAQNRRGKLSKRQKKPLLWDVAGKSLFIWLLFLPLLILYIAIFIVWGTWTAKFIGDTAYLLGRAFCAFPLIMLVYPIGAFSRLLRPTLVNSEIVQISSKNLKSRNGRAFLKLKDGLEVCVAEDILMRIIDYNISYLLIHYESLTDLHLIIAAELLENFYYGS
jgi:hypothetical protein